MKTSLKYFVVLIFLALTNCAGQDNPVALTPVDPSPDSPITDLATKLSPDGRAAGPITLYQAVIVQGVPSKVAKVAFEKYDKFKAQINRQEYIAMIDFTQHSGNLRFYFVNRKSGAVEQWAVAHGAGSDPDNDGIAQYFSNVPDSHMSSLGSYLIQEKYQSAKFGESLRLDGLESSNSNVRDRAIVLHPSTYVKDGLIKQGRSWGCPAIPYAKIQSVIARAQGGAFMYVYGLNKRSTASDMGLLQQWNMIPKSLWPSEGEDAPIFGD